MRLRALIVLTLLISLFVGMTFAQSNSDQPLPEPTPTLSPRGLVGIFQTLNVNYGLELDSDTGFDSFPAVSSFIQLFAQKYLGIDPHMPYSSGIYTGYMGYDQFNRMTYFLIPEQARVTFEEHRYSLFEKHYLIASVGLRKDGFSIVYTDRCLNPACNTPQEHMKRFQDEALAIYGLYVPGNVGSETEALSLIQQTYPALSILDFETFIAETEGEEERYNFRVQTTTSIDGVDVPLSYFVGTLNIPRYTLVYVIIGVGEDSAPVMMSNFPDDQ